MPFEENPEQNQTSKYNSGINQIMRLDMLWKDAHNHSRQGKLHDWNWDLDRVWCELGGDLDEDDKRVIHFNEFTLMLSDLNKTFIQRQINLEEFQQKRYYILMEKEMFLRRLQNKLGKGTALVDADEDNIE